jgi:hypothetical protein
MLLDLLRCKKFELDMTDMEEQVRLGVEYTYKVVDPDGDEK